MQVHLGHAALDRPRTFGKRRSTLRQDDGFVLRHFAGDVLYVAHGFLRKNAESLPGHLEHALFASAESLPAQATLACLTERGVATLSYQLR